MSATVSIEAFEQVVREKIDLENEMRYRARESSDTLRWAMRMKAALEDIGTMCESFVQGTCQSNGRDRHAKYGADRWCNGCIAAAGLGVDSQPYEINPES